MEDQQLKNLLNQSSDLICILNQKLEISWANNRLYQTLGWLQGDLQDEKFIDFIVNEDQDSFIKSISIFENTDQASAFNVSCLHKNGSIVAVQFKIQKDDKSNTIFLVGSINHNTQKSESELIEEEKRYKSLVENSTNGIAILQPDGSTSYVSPGVIKILGYPEKEIINMKLSDILHPEDAPNVFLSISEALNNPGVPILGNLSRVKRKDGTWIWVEATITNLLHDPFIKGIVDDFKDVTLTKTVTENLEKSKENYQKLFNFSPLPMWIYDLEDFQIREVNEAAIHHYGYSREEFLQMTIMDVRPDTDRHLVREAHKQNVNKSGFIQFGIITHQKKDGGFCKMDILGQKLLYNNKHCVIAAAEDVTEKELINSIEQLEREIMQKSIQTDFDLQVLLEKYVKGIESLFPDMFVSVLKVQDNKVWDYISPSLPEAFLQVINGQSVGPSEGTCGTAAYTGKKVIVSDISTSKLWKDYKKIAKDSNLKSSWSQPIFNANREVIATFANYYSYIKIPTPLEQELFDRSAALLSLLFEHHQKSKDLLASNERFTYINKVTNDAIYDWDVEKDVFNWSESFHRIFGHSVKGIFRLENWVELMHHEDHLYLGDKWEKFISDKKQNKWMHEFRFQKKDGSFAYVEEIGYMLRDSKGKALRMFGVIRDRTKQKTELLQNQLLEDISQLFNKSISIKETMEEVLAHLNSFGEFDLSEAWLINEEKSQISLIAYSSDFEKADLFYDESKTLQDFVKGQGLPGAVWESGKAIIWDELDSSLLFKRHKAAKKAGLKSGLGLPIIHNKKLIGVLVFGTHLSEHQLKYYKDFFSQLENRLGSEIIRKKAEEELHMFFQYSPDILCIAAQDGKFRKVNPAFSKLMGYTEKELTNQPFSNFVVLEDQPDTLLEYNETISGKRQAIDYINRYITKTGEERWISWNSSQVYGNEGLVFVYGRDVTEKKELEDLLEHSNQLAQIGGWEYDLETQEIFWSPITRSIHDKESDFNPTLEEVLDFYKKGDDREKLIEVINRAIEKHEKWDLELIIITANKKERWVRTIGEPEIKDGKCVKIVGSFQDIHKYKELELRLKSVSNNIPGVIFQYKIKPNGIDQLQLVSNGSREIWGMSPQECEERVDLVWQQIKAGGDIQDVKASIQESMQNLSAWQFEWRSIQPDGSMHWHKGKASPHEQVDGSVVWDALIIDVTDKKELEFLVERSSQLARIGSWEMDLSGRLKDPIFWSPMAKNIFEVEEDFDVSYSSGIQFFKEESRQKLETALTDLIEADFSYDLELLIKTAKGNEKWTRCIGQAERLEGKCVKIFGSIQDIHERKIAELELQKILKERNTILENISDGFFSVDNKWIVKYWNEKAELLLHTPKNDIINKNLWGVFDDAMELESFKKYHQAMKEQQPVYFDDYYDAVNKWFEISAYPSENGLSVFFKDVTERKQNEELLKQSNERFEMIAQATNDAIWDYNVLENTLYWGGGFQELFQHDLKKINPSFELLMSKIHPDDRDRVAQKIQEYMSSTTLNNWREEYKFMKGDGSYAYVIDRAIFLRDKKGKVVRVLGAMTDITYRKEFEESLKDLNATLDQRAKELIKSNTELEQFAYVASHDLQEPLRMITSFLTLLSNKYGVQLDEKANKYIHFAVDGAERMRQIILDLLEFSRAGKTEQDYKKTNIKAVIDEACLLQRKVIQDKKAKIVINNLPEIEIYKVPYLQVFQNLVGNALKYTEKDRIPEISISSKSNKNFYTISVKDNGIGIEKAHFDKIFVIFKRLHTKEEFKGTGMGLAIVKKIIESFGGKIWVDSEPGKGSTFYFTIPKY